MEEIIGKVSGLIVLGSVIPYSIRIYQRKTNPNLMSWAIWSFVGFAILLTYESSGAKDNIWPVIFGFFNPLLVTILILWRGRKREKPNQMELSCIGIATVSIIFWFFVQNSKELSQYANYIAITADACAAIPTILYYFKKPHEDRPFAWVMYAIGYGLAIFAVTEPTIANYALLLYMFFGALFISMPLIFYRVKNKISLKEYI